MRLLGVLAAGGWLLLAALPPLAHAQAIDPESYRRLVGEAEAALASARGASAEAQARAAAAAAARLREAAAVQAGRGAVHPRNEAALQALERQPPDLEGALARLGSLRRALERVEPPEAAEQRLEALRAVLARPEFQAGGLGGLDPLLGPLVAAARRALFETLAAVGRLFLGQGQLGLYLAGGVAVGVVVAAGLFVWRSLRGSLVAEVDSTSASGTDGRVSASRLWAEGQRLAERGDFRAAIHAFYLSAALHLDELGLLAFDPSQTNREHLARLSHGEARERLEPLVARFDELWYGHVPCGAAEAESVRELAGRVRGLAG